MAQRVTILGSTGSIGVSTLDVISRHPDLFEVYALSAYSQADLLAEQCIAFAPKYAVIGQEHLVKSMQDKFAINGCDTQVLVGTSALEDIAKAPSVDSVMAAIVGAAGLLPTYAAVEAGKRVMLANKESLVMSGGIFMQAAKKSGAIILPTDSEHNAIFQALPEACRIGANNLRDYGVEKILLTGSGGPFRTLSHDSLEHVTPAQACTHPNWTMGKKISVDSSTMMNKGLEFIEACWLFGAKPQDIEVVIHPQSIVHSMVRFVDGSVLAQLGQPDMRTPIAHCLAWPERIDAGVPALDFTDLVNLEFCAPNMAQFPGLKASIDAMSQGGSYTCALNAANEIAVEAFLAGEIKFTGIYGVIAGVLEKWDNPEPTSIEMVIDADLNARRCARELLAQAPH